MMFNVSLENNTRTSDHHKFIENSLNTLQKLAVSKVYFKQFEI